MESCSETARFCNFHLLVPRSTTLPTPDNSSRNKPQNPSSNMGLCIILKYSLSPIMVLDVGNLNDMKRRV
uniref:Uncharacterized protein n=1 Tax=Megaselia scalaris TaxID=36166 RepID=T1GB61_MEGSC